jgi:hypothetical protein
MSAQIDDAHRSEACTTDREGHSGECICAHKLLIGCRLVRGAETLNVVNPAMEEILAVAPRAEPCATGSGRRCRQGGFPSLGGSVRLSAWSPQSRHGTSRVEDQFCASLSSGRRFAAAC